MEFYGDVVVRRGIKYWIGSIKDTTFTPVGDVRKAEDISGLKLITLYDYSRFIGLDYSKKKLDEIRHKIGYSEIWVIEEESPKATSSGVSDTAWRKWYFKFIHPMCQKCTKECKQSFKVFLMCNKFEEKQ
jgi:hypothetical protein